MPFTSATFKIVNPTSMALISMAYSKFEHIRTDTSSLTTIYKQREQFYQNV